MADIPPEHGLAKAEAGRIVRLVAKKFVIVSTLRWLRRLLLAVDSCFSLPAIILRMTMGPLVFAPEAISTPEACDARVRQWQERRN